MFKGLTINGITYDVAVSVQRTTTMSYSDLTGTLEDRRYFVEPIGAYPAYRVSIAVPKNRENDYANMYDAIMDIDNGGENQFYFPYNQEIKEIRGRVNSITDTYVKEEGSIILWRKISFTVYSNYPIDEVLT